MSGKELIDGCSFSVEWLLKSLKENDKEFQQKFGKKNVKEVTAYDISDGRGVASVVLRCTIHFIDSNETYSTILKVPGMEVIKQVQLKMNGKTDLVNDILTQRFNDAHQRECKFYNEIASFLNAPIPKVYKTEDWILNEKEGCIHMEDLSQKGKTISYFETINLTQVKNFIQHLAKMHKSILSADPKIWKGKFVENAEFFMYYFDILEEQNVEFLKICSRREEFRPLFEKFRKLRTNKDFLLYAQTQYFHDLKMPTVIVHNDIHAGNILWKVNSNGDIENEIEALLDWQLMHEGSPMTDLSRFLTHLPNAVVRRQSEVFAFDFYYQCLTKEFEGDLSKVPFTVEQLRKGYYYGFTIQTFFTVPMVMFFFAAIKDKIKCENVQKAFFDNGIQKALDAYKDLDRIYNGEMKDVLKNMFETETKKSNRKKRVSPYCKNIYKNAQ
uniref:CHK kinase-like domain-containing protein n=1 Tax=Panagrolaimus sp. PS1159 TaxID=55785 RepID=A0AC35F5A8_9BILA